jgi:hypothetical protein
MRSRCTLLTPADATQWQRTIALAVVILLPLAASARQVTRAEAVAALRKAVRFFHEEVSSHGGYLWSYSGDLSLREGEGKANEDTIWVQPPGTPAVGDVFLDAFEATGDKRHLDAARDAATALLLGQLHSGGWHYRITFAPAERAAWSYRFDLDWRPMRDPVSQRDRAGQQGWHVWRQRRYKGNMTIMDDDTTQATLRFLMRLDRVLEFKNPRVHEAVMFGLDSVLRAQYPNGAWSHNYDRFPGQPPEAVRYPLRRASYPPDWSRTWPKSYTGCYMLNDAITPRTIETMLLAYDIYGQERFLRSAMRGGDFLLLAQMPEPQPAWAQQYDPNMHPVWDRAFEAPAISGRESQTVLETLLLLNRRTGRQRFVEPVPRALQYLRRSLLPDGRLARFYELTTNRPLYFIRDRDGRYQLTYERKQLPDHYAFVVGSRLDAIEAEYRRLAENGPSAKPSPPTIEAVRRIMESVDERGAWVEKGRLRHHKLEPKSGIIDSQTFITNVETLCAFLQTRDPGG